MAIRTFSAQYREEGIEPRKKLKRVRSVKVANLDRLRLSMRREKSRFNRCAMASMDDVTEASESSSTGISGTSSPSLANYMKDTTSSSARKGSLTANSDNIQSSSASSSDTRTTERQDNSASPAKPVSKSSKVPVQGWSDPAGVNVPVIVKPKKFLKRVSSLKHSKKLTTKKSMKIRAKYSQFQDVDINQDEMLSFDVSTEFWGDSEINDGGTEIDPESPNASSSHGQGSTVKTGVQQRGFLQRSRSRKLIRTRSIRSSQARQRQRQRQQSRFSSGASELMSHEAEASNAEPHYMKGTSSQELKKNSDKGLTRTSSLRPFRILAKIPSLRSKRSKASKRPQATLMSGTSVDRATCSSVLKRAELSDGIELHPQSREPEGATPLHVCPYSYCSIHGQRHHSPSQPVKEFVSARRKLVSNKKGEKTKESQSGGELEHHHTKATESEHSRKMASAENNPVQEVLNATTECVTEAEDDGTGFLIKNYANPRNKWATEATQNNDAEALDYCTYDQKSVGDYEGKAETVSETSGSEETQGVLNGDQQEIYESINQNHNSNIAALSLPSSDHLHLASRDSAFSSSGDLINIFSDNKRYTNMWQLIHQQLLSSESSINEAKEVTQANEREGEDGNTHLEISSLDPEQSEYNNHLSDDVDDQIAVTEKLESHQDAAMKLVQEAVNAILQRDAESYDQQSNPDHEMAKSFVREHISSPTAFQEETFREDRKLNGKETNFSSEDKKHPMKQIGEDLLQKEPSAQEMSARKMSNSLSKLRKMFVTAKFIKSMERLKKIHPQKPTYLSAKAASENERVNLRQLSMNGMKNTEEWMLDNALRQVISRLDPDQQRRVAQLVEAFETVAPEQEEKSNKRHPMKRVLAPGDKLDPSMTCKEELFVEPEQDTSLSYEQVAQQQDAVPFHKDVSREQCFREEHDYQAITTGDKILQESDETNMSGSTLILAETSSESVCVDSALDDGSRDDEEPENTLKAPPQFPTKNSEVNEAGETTIFFNKKKYRSMWNMIYKHVVTSEVASSANQQVNKFDDEHDDDDKNNSKEINDTDSISSDYSMEQNEDSNDQIGAGEKPELDQSAAIKLVKEALGAILNRYEKQTHLQSIPEPDKVSNDAKDHYFPTHTFSTEENSIEGGKGVEKHTYSDVEDKMDQVEDESLPLQQQVECSELKAPQRKMSKSLSKLKKAIATARFIKAMERLTKSSPRKSQNLSSNETSEEERVYLRHRSIDGRKKGEEWMLDFALRQVISKMAADQQRRVERLVEAFETVHPEHTEKGVLSHPLKGEAADESELAKNCYLKPPQQRSLSVEQVPQKQNDGSLPPTRNASLHLSLEEDHDQQLNLSETTTRNASLERNVQKNYYPQTSATVTDGIILQETNETAISESALDLAGNRLKSPSVADKPEEQTTRDGETKRAMEFPSPISTVNSKVRQDGNMATILLNQQKYTSMWHLIHQHVLSNEASTIGKQEVDEVNENKQNDDANKNQATNDLESTENTHLKNFKVDEENQSATFDQSAALNLVKDAINAILQCHEHGSDQQSHKEHGRSADNTICDKNNLAFTKENYGGNRMVKQIGPEPEEKLHEANITDATLQQQAEAKTSQRKMSTGISKLRKAIATAKFIKAMERLRKINPRKIQHLSAEPASEKERVHLRHLSINEKKNDEEWMLDYALRKVLSNLSPEEQSKVALIVEAFETVNPRQKGISSVTKSDWDTAIETESTAHKKQFLQFKHDSSKPNDEDIPPMHNDRLNSLNMLGKVTTLENSKQEDNSIEFSNHKTEMSGKIVEPDDSNFHIQHQTRSRGSPNSNSLTVKKEEIGANPRHELLQQAKDSEQDTETNIAKDGFCEKQKNTSMWHLIYQHVGTTGAAEAQSKHSERQTNEDSMNRGCASSDMIADADSDDSDASSVTSELNESDATKLVREAINNILNTPENLENDTASSNETTASEEGQKASAEEKSTESLTKAYSRLRKLIICNKFIKAMEKTKKTNPQKRVNPTLQSDSKTEKAHLKSLALGERKGMDEWMLDNVLQNVIAELAPVQQRRVSMLVEAFEKVPDPQQRGKRLSSSTTKSLETNSSKENFEEKEDIKSSMNAKCSDDFGLKLNESTTSSREILTERIPQETCKDKTLGLSKEYALEGDNQSSGPCYTTTTKSDAIRTLPNICKDPTDFDEADVPHVPLEEKTTLNEVAVQSEGTSTEDQLLRNTEQTSTHPQPDDLKNEWNYGANKARSSGKSTNLWGLILQKVTTDMLEKDEAPNTGEIDENAKRDSVQMLERRTDDTSQASSKAKSCRDMGVQTPTSFDFQEDEAIKLVEEAVEEILLIQDQISDTESMTSSTTSEQEIYSPKNEDASEPSFAATETVNMAELPYTVATSEEEKSSSKEILPKSYNTLSKVILCKRFVKAMDKMRKLKAQSTQSTSQPPQKEEKGIPALRQTLTGDKTSWDEGMLDNALQKVIGNLAPAKKKRVALLVHAFETVGSHPESTSNGSRGKAAVS